MLTSHQQLFHGERWTPCWSGCAAAPCSITVARSPSSAIKNACVHRQKPPPLAYKANIQCQAVTATLSMAIHCCVPAPTTHLQALWPAGRHSLPHQQPHQPSALLQKSGPYNPLISLTAVQQLQSRLQTRLLRDKPCSQVPWERHKATCLVVPHSRQEFMQRQAFLACGLH